MEYPWPELPVEDRRLLAECDKLKEALVKAGDLSPARYTAVKQTAIKDGCIEPFYVWLTEGAVGGAS